jgi:hypothetical protein
MPSSQAPSARPLPTLWRSEARSCAQSRVIYLPLHGSHFPSHISAGTSEFCSPISILQPIPIPHRWQMYYTSRISPRPLSLTLPFPPSPYFSLAKSPPVPPNSIPPPLVSFRQFNSTLNTHSLAQCSNQRIPSLHSSSSSQHLQPPSLQFRGF